MADRKTVISHLQIIHTWAEFARERDLQFFTAKHLEDIAQWTKDTLELLKEQEAKKVTWRVGRAHCPSCGELFPKKQDKQYIRFCNYCGQAVKWDA